MVNKRNWCGPTTDSYIYYCTQGLHKCSFSGKNLLGNVSAPVVAHLEATTSWDNEHNNRFDGKEEQVLNAGE